ncbi:MAG TPA: NAD-dependent protein deacetylase [Solirubrobacteraceae bacterium]|nr:NAD-dependent protein deacetylase [Solirubrobacteraceae bacterium]
MTELGAVDVRGLEQLRELIDGGDVVVLSGAGISTESGIPDYRGPNGRLRARLPISIGEFTGSAAARRRYWARAHAGWRRMAHASPNAGHRAVAELQRRGLLVGVITQNVDGLHQAAGARDVIELHGGLHDVICLDCGHVGSRAELDDRLRAANPGFAERTVAINPDGDAELPADQIQAFALVGCDRCGSDLVKPDVVFFGENVPRPRVDRCYELVASSALLLVLGSSLQVMSGLRFVHRAARDGIPAAIVNRGVTRGDEHALIKVDAPLGDTLTALVAEPGSAEQVRQLRTQVGDRRLERRDAVAQLL